MTKTLEPRKTKEPDRIRGPIWALAAFVGVLAVAALYLAFSGDGQPAVDTTPTTSAPDIETTTNLQIIEAGVEALYSGDFERAVQLFELPAPDDDVWIRAEAQYQAAVGGHLGLDCTERATPGVFDCLALYGNVFTDAVGWVDTPGTWVRVIVEDDTIV